MSRVVVLGGGESGVGSAVLAKVKGFDVFLSDMGRIIKNSPNVQERVNKGDAFLVSCTFSPVNLDTAVKESLQSLMTGGGQNQKQAENLKQLMKTVANPQTQQVQQPQVTQPEPKPAPAMGGMGGGR